MRRIKSLMTLGLLILLCCPQPVDARAIRSIRDLFEQRKAARVFVSDIKNASATKGLDIAGLKESVQDTLAERKSHSFEIVSTREQADIVIDMEVLEYLWTDTDPIDTIVGIFGTAYDLATTTHYARMRTHVKISHSTSGRLIWDEKVTATLNHPDMSEEESFPLMNKEWSKTFVRNLLRRPRGR